MNWKLRMKLSVFWGMRKKDSDISVSTIKKSTTLGKLNFATKGWCYLYVDFYLYFSAFTSHRFLKKLIP